MSIASSLQSRLLPVIGLGILLTLGKLIVSPAGSRRHPIPTFPQQLPLKQDKTLTPATERDSNIALTAVASTAVEPKNTVADPISPEQGYESILAEQQYTHADLTLALYYVVNTSGDMYSLLEKYDITVPSEPTAFQDRPSPYGPYRLFQSGQNIHLVSCLNPNGLASVSMEQFQQHRKTYDLTGQQFVKWLSGQSSLIDRRCLWVDLMISAEGHTLESADQWLRPVWLQLADWWQPRFPEA